MENTRSSSGVKSKQQRSRKFLALRGCLGVLGIMLLCVMSLVGLLAYIRWRHSATITPTSFHIIYSATDLGSTTLRPAGDLIVPDGDIAGINADGQIAGDLGALPFLWAPTTPHGAKGAWLDFRMVFAAQHAQLSKQLGQPFPKGFIKINALNAFGQVTGYFSAVAYRVQADDGIPFLWTPTHPHAITGTITLLELPAHGILHDRVIALNSWGQALLYQNYQAGSLWTPQTANGTTGTLTSIPAYGGDTSVDVSALNDYGQVIAESYTSNPEDLYLWTPPTPHGANGKTGFITLLDANGGLDAGGSLAINNYGQVIGANANAQPFLWTPTQPNGRTGTKTVLSPLIGDGEIDMYGLSGTGIAIGISRPIFAGYLGGDSAVAWVPTRPNSATGQLIPLGSIENASDSYVDKVTPGGIVLGSSCNVRHNVAPPYCQSDDHLMYWDQRHGLHDLAALVDTHDRALYNIDEASIEAMNDAGEIVLFADRYNPNDKGPHLVLLTPHPAPYPM